MFKIIITMLFVIQLIASQNNTVTVYTDLKVNKVAQFERDIIKRLYELNDKKKKAKTTINFVEMNSFKEAFDYMDKNKNTDLKNNSFAINKISFTNDRAQKYSFSIPYMLNYYSVMTLTSKAKLHNLKKFDSNYTYGAVIGTIFEDKVKELAKSQNIKFKTYSSVKVMNDALQSGQIDFMVTDYVDSWEFGLKSVFFYEQTTDKLCIILPKDSKLKKELDTLLKYYLKSQQFLKLVKDYFGNDAVTFFKQSNTR